MSEENSAKIPSEASLGRLADLINEVGMLRKVARSGFAFLGSGKESVAEHSYRVSVIGFILAKFAGANVAKTTFLCLFHDLHEARTGDFNYVNHRYNTCDARAALKDACEGTGLENDVLSFWDELEAQDTPEALLASDADQLDLIFNLREELNKGNEFAREWLDSALKRLKTPVAIELADKTLRTDPNAWWYGRFEQSWWINHAKESGS